MIKLEIAASNNLSCDKLVATSVFINCEKYRVCARDDVANMKKSIIEESHYFFLREVFFAFYLNMFLSRI